MIRCREKFSNEPIGKKWYTWSGSRQLVLNTDAGPLGAALELLNRAMLDEAASELGDYIFTSQRGFDEKSIAWAADTRDTAHKYFPFLFGEHK